MCVCAHVYVSLYLSSYYSGSFYNRLDSTKKIKYRSFTLSKVIY